MKATSTEAKPKLTLKQRQTREANAINKMKKQNLRRRRKVERKHRHAAQQRAR